MKLFDKILFLQKSMNLNDHEFLTRFKIKSSSFKKWKSGSTKPIKEEVELLAKEFNLDLDDFVDDNSVLLKTDLKPGEHVCKLVPNKGLTRTDIILEDFAREDNSRYEEKD